MFIAKLSFRETYQSLGLQAKYIVIGGQLLYSVMTI